MKFLNKMLYTKNLSYTNFYLFFLLFLFSCRNANCQTEDYFSSTCNYVTFDNSLNDGECFNNVLIFKNKNYQLNHLAKNKNGDLVTEFAECTDYDILSSSRLFYGLKKDGRYFFSNESSYTREFNINIDEETYYGNDYFILGSSKNLFVTKFI